MLKNDERKKSKTNNTQNTFSENARPLIEPTGVLVYETHSECILVFKRQNALESHSDAFLAFGVVVIFWEIDLDGEIRAMKSESQNQKPGSWFRVWNSRIQKQLIQNPCAGHQADPPPGKQLFNPVRGWILWRKKMVLEGGDVYMEPTWGQEGKVTGARSKVVGFRFGPRGCEPWLWVHVEWTGAMRCRESGIREKIGWICPEAEFWGRILFREGEMIRWKSVRFRERWK